MQRDRAVCVDIVHPHSKRGLPDISTGHSHGKRREIEFHEAVRFPHVVAVATMATAGLHAHVYIPFLPITVVGPRQIDMGIVRRVQGISINECGGPHSNPRQNHSREPPHGRNTLFQGHSLYSTATSDARNPYQANGRVLHSLVSLRTSVFRSGERNKKRGKHAQLQKNYCAFLYITGPAIIVNVTQTSGGFGDRLLKTI